MTVREEIKLKSRQASRQSLLFKINIAVGLIGLSIAGFIFLARFDKLFISEVKFVGNRATASDDLNQTAKNVLAQNYFYLFSKQNFFLAPKKLLGEEVIKQHLWIDRVVVKAPKIGELLVIVNEREPESVWCKNSIKDDCFFVDQGGFIFSPAPHFSDNVFVKIYDHHASSTDLLGTYPISQSKFKQISFIKQAIPQIFESIGFNQVDVEKIIIENEQDVRTFVDGKIGDRKINWEILFDTKDDLQNVASNVSAAFRLPEFQKELEAKDWKIKYLDLRFGNKIFYTFENEQAQVVEEVNNIETE